jgi:mycothiol synthase
LDSGLATIIRNYRTADLSEYIRFHTEAESVCHSDDSLLLASLTGASSGPTTFSKEDFFLAVEQGRIVGACRVVQELAIDRVVLRLLIKPGLLEKGTAAKLLLAALRRTSDLRAAKAHADVRETDRAAHDLFTGLGFKSVRRYSEMKLDLQHIPKDGSDTEALFKSPLVPLYQRGRRSGTHSEGPPIDPENLFLRALEPGHEPEFTQLQNDAFKSSWGFCPNTTSEIVQLLNTPGYGHEGVIIAYHGETAIGYCWTAEVRRPDREGGEAIGRIHMMGIVPEFRGRGLGKCILGAGLKHLSSRGLQTIELTMDNENKAACSLYKRAGFKLKTALIWYEKQI